MNFMNFKVGDMVYSLMNCEWGMKPMKVIALHPGMNSITCMHPDNGRGAFIKENLELFTEERKAKLAPYIVIKRIGGDFQGLEYELFGRGL